MESLAGARPRERVQPRGTSAWTLIAREELAELWLRGRGIPLMLAYSVLLSGLTYLAATNQGLNFLEQREALNLVAQAAVSVGALLGLLVSADAISGERERGTLEALLLTPAPRRHIVAGKLVAAASVWLGALLVFLPYAIFLAAPLGTLLGTMAVTTLTGTLLTLALVSLGIIVSALSDSNRVSLSISLFVLLALFAPTQLPGPAQRGWFGQLIQHVNPFTACAYYLKRVVVDARSWTQDASWLLAPTVAALLLTVLAIVGASEHLHLSRGRGA